MTVIRGEHNSWQVSLGRDGQDHIIAKCGSHTGHVVRAVAFCDSVETAAILVEALALLKKIYDANPTRNEQIKALLERAGLV